MVSAGRRGQPQGPPPDRRGPLQPRARAGRDSATGPAVPPPDRRVGDGAVPLGQQAVGASDPPGGAAQAPLQVWAVSCAPSHPPARSASRSNRLRQLRERTTDMKQCR